MNNEEENDSMWSDISDFLMKCNYVQTQHFSSIREHELNVLSLNVRSLPKNMSAIAENIDEFQKFDVLCLNKLSS